MEGSSGEDRTLTKISAACRKARSGSLHPRYPDEVKEQVQKLVKDGVTASVISRSTGLSYSVIRKWSRCEALALEPVRVLPVLNDRKWFNGPGDPILMLKAGDVEIAVFSRRPSS